MKFNHHPLLFSLLGLTSMAVLAGAVPKAEAQTRRWNRQEDFVLFTGDQVPTLLGAEARDLHLYACGRAGFRAIPFQVDKRDQEGRYVFPNEKLRDPLRDGTRLDANDELVFMAKDAGGPCPPEPVYVEAATRGGVAMELRDPLDDGRAWVYLFDQPGAEPPQTEDYVRHRIENNKELISSDQYEIGQQLGVTYYDWLRIRKPDGGFSPDVLNRTKVGLRARLLNVGIPINVPEKDMKSVTLGVIDGPVRVIRDELDLVKIKALGLDWETEAFYTYYGNGHISPMEANIPVNLHKLFLDINFYWAMDLNEAIMGSTFRNQANPRGVVLDGKSHADLDKKGDTSFLTVSGPQGGMVDALVFDQTLSRLLVRTTLVREELANPDSPEEHPGQLLVGYWVKSAGNMPKGVYHWQLYHYYPYPFSEGEVPEILNLIERPIQVFARPLSSAPAAP
ncbi:MAG: hypothetical protein A2V67_18625 [Deltaproteobacteria bacterium RBG_13_61_14]|nr:MAG: hypothetical protein A2V67_18625 [Deltaproteobacteria bacterium RBG_13_61_14]